MVCKYFELELLDFYFFFLNKKKVIGVGDKPSMMLLLGDPSLLSKSSLN